MKRMCSKVISFSLHPKGTFSNVSMKLSSAVRALVVILTFSLLITLSVYKYLESAPSTYLSIRPAQELSNVSHPASNSTQLINPLLSKRCRNAIFDHDRKEMNSEIINFQNGHCPEFTGFYSREAMDALSIKQCPSTHGPVRSHQLLLQWIQLTDEKKASLSEREREEAYKEWFKSFPIYYMIPKGGSSSIFSLLKLTNKYGEFGQIFHENLRYQAPKWNDCSFTFVRNPIDRLLSGYYTLNVKIWRSLDGGFEHWSNETLANRLHRIWNFIKIKGEPLRFQTFVNELVSEPNNFTNSPHHDHVMSISHLLSRHLGYSDPQLNGNLHFVGKVENFTNDMASLMKKCDYFDENDLNLLLEDKRASHQMKSWGWGSPSSGKMNGKNTKIGLNGWD